MGSRRTFEIRRAVRALLTAKGLGDAGGITSAYFIAQLCEARADLPNRNQTERRVGDAPREPLAVTSRHHLSNCRSRLRACGSARAPSRRSSAMWLEPFGFLQRSP
jgi:hypothetical protein